MRRRSGAFHGSPVTIALVEDAGALDEARAQGFDLALGLEAAGADLWASLGFRPLPASETACRTVLPAAWPREPAWVAACEEPEARVPGLRVLQPDDLEAVRGIHREQTRDLILRVDRGREDWERILEARRSRARLHGENGPFWVLERGGRVEGYVALEVATPTLRWREHGARTGASGVPVDLFWSALAWARRRGLPRIEGWRMPEALTLGPLYPASERRRRDGIPMILPLTPGLQPGDFGREEDCRLFELDVLENQ